MKVFISWSGTVSERIGGIVGGWLDHTLLNTESVYTPEYLRAGTHGMTQLYELLAEINTGILIYTPESIYSQWMVFEAGALFKDTEQSVIIPLLFNLSYRQLPGPILTYQWKTFSEDRMLEVVQSINEQLGAQRLSEHKLRYVFEREWPKLNALVNEALLDLKIDDQPLDRQVRHLYLENQTLNHQLATQRQRYQQLRAQCYEYRKRLSQKHRPGPAAAHDASAGQRLLDDWARRTDFQGNDVRFLKAMDLLEQKQRVQQRLQRLKKQLQLRYRLHPISIFQHTLYISSFGIGITLLFVLILGTIANGAWTSDLSASGLRGAKFIAIVAVLGWVLSILIDSVHVQGTLRLQQQGQELHQQVADLETTLEAEVKRAEEAVAGAE